MRPSGGSLVVIQPGTEGPPVFCFHAFSGSVAPYGDLVAQLGRDRAAYGFEAIGLNGGQPPDRTVPDMAHRYATELAANPPPGRCLFLGYSLGGVLAIETGRLVGHLLDERPIVVAIDSDPHYTTTGPGDAWSILVHQTLDLDLPVAGLPELAPEDALAAVRAAATAQGKLPPRFGLDRLATMLEVCRANERAAAEYRPRPYSGTVFVIRSGDPPDPDGWDGLVADLVVRHVAGDHHSIMSRTGYPRLVAGIREALR